MIKKLIVTGGLGFIGSNLIQLLINKKYKVDINQKALDKTIAQSLLLKHLQLEKLVN